MIISASRREDMPAFRPEYLADMLRQGETEVVNPFNPAQRRVISLRPEAVDGIVLWSKNPASLLEEPLRSALSPYAFYVQFTLNAYGRDLEPGVPPLDARIELFHRLADAYGPERVQWRYDPIAMTPAYTAAWHVEQFDRLARALQGSAPACVFSFMDVYRRIAGAMKSHKMRPPEPGEEASIAMGMAKAAKGLAMALFTCAEPGDWSCLGIAPARCIDADRLSKIAGRPILAERDANQRPNCGCAKAVDVGRYAACAHGCAYCYAARGARGW